MDQMNITLNLASLLYQQSVLFFEEIQQQSRELLEFMLTNFTIIPTHSDSENEQSKDEISNKLKIEAQEQSLEQNQSVYIQTEQEKQQLNCQLYSYKRERQNSNIIFDVPEQINGIYLLKDKLAVPSYVPQEVMSEKQGIKKNKSKSSEKVSQFKTNLQQSQVITVKKGKFDIEAEGDIKQKINNQQKRLQITEFFNGDEKQEKKITKKKITKKKIRKLKRQLQIDSLQFDEDVNQLKDQLCSYCDQKFYKFVTLLEHEADHHGIMRTKEEIFGDDLWQLVNKKIENKSQKQI